MSSMQKVNTTVESAAKATTKNAVFILLYNDFGRP